MKNNNSVITILYFFKDAYNLFIAGQFLKFFRFIFFNPIYLLLVLLIFHDIAKSTDYII